MNNPIEQHQQLKKDHPESIILIRVGDFYETFFDDAEFIASTGMTTLTIREKKSEKPIPMTGFPFYNLLNVIDTLKDCEQSFYIT